MDKIDSTKHAEAIMRSSGLMNAAELARRPAILTACAASADDAARAMREEAEMVCSRLDASQYKCFPEAIMEDACDGIRAIDPATSRDS
ncbi:hypothetical protein OY671_009827 [Metschnikowia pulcherrima]|nr:hypothetical protein OY671_009827 [Metschnikowia pulcherrima]